MTPLFEKYLTLRVLLLSPALMLAAALFYALQVKSTVKVTIDSSVKYQTILGWGACAPGIKIPQALREQILNEATSDLGLTRLRLEPPSGNRSHLKGWEWVNDNGDPGDIDWTAFATAAVDERVSDWVTPFKRRVEEGGEPFNLYVSPSFFDGGSSGSVPVWLLHSPGEYAEYATSFLLYLKKTHNITANYYCICNEAGNHNAFTPAVVGKMIKTLGPRLKALGLATQIQFPECVNANVSWRYIQALQSDAQVWPYVGLITYHLYGKNDARPRIRDFAIAKGLPTGQTEYMGLTINHLYDDLLFGGVSYWELYGMGNYLKPNYDMTSFSRYQHYWNFRQVMHYVRPGAVRVGAASDDPALRSLAFVQSGKTTVVLLNDAKPLRARTVKVRNLAPDTYGVCQSTGGRAYQELGLRTVGETGTLTVNVPPNAVLTIYLHPGTNQPPTVTDWRARPNYLTLPASRTTLTASATDPERDALSYGWSIISQPAGANVVLATPKAPRTSATGLTVAGQYIFAVAVSDGRNTVTRQVVLNVYSGNQPPVPVDVHNRIPVMVTLPQSRTELRAGAFDLEGDPLRYKWSVVSQPAGASVSLSNATTTKCKASNMTLPGDYVFKFQVSDPTHTVSENLTVTVYPENIAPVISNVTATPPRLRLPASNTFLSAKTGDPDGDIITHWWSVKSKPAGAKPVFANQASANTKVSGLTVAGTYVFTLTVIDQTKFTTSEVTVTVAERARSKSTRR